MKDVHTELEGKDLETNGDGPFDSPGHSALYGVYTFMDAATSLIFSSAILKVLFSLRLLMVVRLLHKCRKLDVFAVCYTDIFNPLATKALPSALTELLTLLYNLSHKSTIGSKIIRSKRISNF